MAKASKEIILVTEYINEYLAGKKPAKPMVADKGVQQLLMNIDRKSTRLNSSHRT